MNLLDWMCYILMLFLLSLSFGQVVCGGHVYQVILEFDLIFVLIFVEVLLFRLKVIFRFGKGSYCDKLLELILRFVGYFVDSTSL